MIPIFPYMVAFIYNDSTVQLASGSLHGGSVAVLLLLSILLNTTAATVWPGSTGCNGAVEQHCRLGVKDARLSLVGA